MPERDKLQRHNTQDDGLCPCMPRRVGDLVVHNSFDGREAGTVMRSTLDALWGAIDPSKRAALEDGYRHAKSLSLLHFPGEDK